MGGPLHFSRGLVKSSTDITMHLQKISALGDEKQTMVELM